MRKTENYQDTDHSILPHWTRVKKLKTDYGTYTWAACGDILAEAVEDARAACGAGHIINDPESNEGEHERTEA